MDLGQLPLDVVERAIYLVHGSGLLRIVIVGVSPDCLELCGWVRDDWEVATSIVVSAIVRAIIGSVVATVVSAIVGSVVAAIIGAIVSSIVATVTSIVGSIVSSLWARCFSITKVVTDASLVIILSVHGVGCLPLNRNALCITVPAKVKVSHSVTESSTREAA